MRTARAVRISLAFAALLPAACDGSEPPSANDRTSCIWTIGTMASLSGDAADETVRVFRAIELAVDTATERRNIACDLDLASEDTTGDVDRARTRARALVDNERLVACICPYRSVDALVSGTVFSSHGVLMASPATANDLADQGFETWFRIVPNETTQAEGTAEYIRGVLQADTVAVIDDGSNQGVALADAVGERLGERVVERATLSTTDATSFAGGLSDSPPQVVYYAGAGGAAGQVTNALAEAKVDSLVVAAGPEPGAVPTSSELGDAANVLVMCACVDPASVAEGGDLVDAYSQAYDELPGMFSAEAYEVTGLVIDALSGLTGEEPIEEVRAAVVAHFDRLEGAETIPGPLEWTDEGELDVDPLDSVWVYEWDPKRGTYSTTGPVASLQ